MTVLRKCWKKIEGMHYVGALPRILIGMMPLKLKQFLVLSPPRTFMKLKQFLVRKIKGIDSEARLSFKEIGVLVKRKDPVILEIGANVGMDTNRFARLFPKGRIYCFEPDPRAAASWRKNVTAANAELHEIAICDKNGMLTFHQSDSAGGWDQSGSIRAPKDHLECHPTITFDKKIEVMGRRLDDWCSEHGISEVDFIWADVQGAEKDLIAGASRILQRARFFYTEYYNQEMYEGQWYLQQIIDALPNHRLHKRFRCDALFALRSLTEQAAV